MNYLPLLFLSLTTLVVSFLFLYARARVLNNIYTYTISQFHRIGIWEKAGAIALVLVLLVWGGVTLSNQAYAATGINRTINFQGKLTNSDGTNVTNGSYSIVFKLYQEASSGTALWTETQTVTVTGGVFRVALGSVTPIPSDFNFNWDGVYLGMKVGADSEMSPRIRMTAAAYAFNAEKVAGLTVQDSSGNASTSGTLQVANGKTIKFGNSFDIGSNAITITTSGSTDLSFGGSGALTLVDTTTAQTVTNKTLTDNSTAIADNGDPTKLLRFDAVNIGAGSTLTLSLPSSPGTADTLCLQTKGNCTSVSSAYWAMSSNLGILYPGNSTVDFLVGGVSTASAKFAILNVAGTTPIASIAGTFSLGSSPGTTRTIGATSMNALQLGDATTGDLLFAPGNTTALTMKTNGRVGLGTLSPLGTFDVRGNLATIPAASISAVSNSFAALVVDTRGLGDIFTASASGLTRLALTNAGQLLLPGQGAGTGLLLGGDTTLYRSGATALTSNATTLNFSGASLTVSSCSGCGGGGGSDLLIQRTGNGVSTGGYTAIGNLTTDFFVGGTSSNAAKFAVLNVNTGVPSASVSAGSSGGAYLNASGTIATSAKQTLTLGASTTGNITIGTDATARTVAIGNATGATALSFTSGTGSQTFSSSVVSGTTSTSAFVYNANSLTTGTGLYLASTNTSFSTGTLAQIAYTPGSTPSVSPTGDLLRLSLGSNATNFSGNYFNIVDSSATSILSASDTQFTTSLPVSFTAAGDVSNSYDLVFTNPTASYIKSAAPLYIVAGEPFNSSNLGLQTYNEGTIVFDTANTTSTAIDYTNATLTTGTGVNITLSGITSGTGFSLSQATSTFTGNLGAISLGNGSGTALNIANGGTGASLRVNDDGTFTDSSPFIIDASGNVGIGTTTTSGFNLDVTGTARFTGAITVASCSGCGAGGGSDLLIQRTGNGVSTGGYTAIGNLTTDFFVGGLSTQAAKFAVLSMNTGTPIASIAGTFTLGSPVGTTRTIGTTAMNALQLGDATTGDLLFAPGNTVGMTMKRNGFIGIGITAPTAFFDLRTTFGTAPAASISARSNSMVALTVDNLGLGDIFTASASGLTRFVIRNNGNVGIGTTTPLAMFDVRGVFGTTPIASISARSSFATMVVDNGFGDIFAASASGLTRFVIRNNGNVGIGTNLPTNLLTVQAPFTPTTDTVNIKNTSGTAVTAAGVNGLQVDWFAAPSSGNINGAQRINITNTNVGAGGTTNALRLVATGTGGNINSATLGLLIDGLASSSIGTLGQNAIQIGTNWNSSIFGEGDLRINANGNIILATSSATTRVGIGTNSPLATLDIRSASSTLAVASVSALSNSFAGMVVDNRGLGDIFTASASGLTRLQLTNAGQLALSGQGLNSGLLLGGDTTIYRSGATALTSNATALNFSSAVLTVSSCSGCGGGGGSDLLIQRTGNGVSTGGYTAIGNLTTDFFVGGLSTQAAKFAVLSMNTGTPIASIAGTFTLGSPVGTTRTIGTTAMNALQLGDATTGDLLFAPGNTVAMTMKRSGAIGIGATSPLATLDIRGLTSTMAVASVSANSNSFAAMVVDNRGTGAIFTASSSGLTRFVIRNDGTLIGGPDAASSIANNLVLPGTVAHFSSNINNYSQINHQNRSNGSSASTDFVATADTGNDTTNYIDFGINSSGYSDPAYTIGGALDGYLYNNGGNLGIGTQTSNKIIKFHTGGTLAANERMRIDGVGNIGIGTTVPLALLDVAGNASISSSLIFRNAAALIAATAENDLTIGDSNTGKLLFNQSGNIGIGTTNTINKLTIQTNDVGDGFGVVATGLLSPQFSLYRDSTQFGAVGLALDNNHFSGVALPEDIIMRAINSGTNGNIVLSVQNPNGGIKFATGIGNGSDTTKMIVTNGGNVGIGTTVPLAKLHIDGVGTTPIASVSGATSFATLIVDNDGVGDIFTASASGATRFTITQNGNIVMPNYNGNNAVLFGTVNTGVLATATTGLSTQCLVSGAGGANTPGWGSCLTGSNTNWWTQNSAQGTIYAGNATVDLLWGGTSTASAGFRLTGATSNYGTSSVASIAANTSFAAMVIDNRGSGDLFTASSSGSTRFVVQNNGNVGIGTASATEKLQVYGNVLIEAMPDSSVADQTTWTKVSQTTPGTIAASGTTLIASISASVSYNGSLYVGTYKDSVGSAEIYRYDGGAGQSWTKVSQTTPGTIAASGTANIASVSAMTVFDGRLYVGTSKSNAAEVYRYEGGTTWTKVSATTAGTIKTGGTALIDGIASMIVFQGKIYVGTREGGAAQLYRYDGGNSWSLLSGTTAGTFITTNTATVNAISSMAVYNGNLYLGTEKPGDADVIRYLGGGNGGTAGTFLAVNALTTTGSYNLDGTSVTAFDSVPAMTVFNGALVIGLYKRGGGGDVYAMQGVMPGETAINTFTRLNNTAGSMTFGGSSAIDGIASMTIYNGNLFIGTMDPNGAEIYQYVGGDQKFFKVSQAAAGTIASGGTTLIDGVTFLQPIGDDLYAGTNEIGKAEVYKYTANFDRSYALKFHATTPIAGGEQNGFMNEAALYFVASASANLGSGAGNTGAIVSTHGIQTRSGSYDVAEDYPTRDDSIEPGDLIAIDADERGFVRKSNKAGDTAVMGIYSEKPALRLTQSDTTINGGRAIPVALVGRVPAKVSTENGPILTGDSLMASSIPGVAMKATKSGVVVGQAMESYDGDGIGKVTVYVNTGSYLGNGVALQNKQGVALLSQLAQGSTISSAESMVYTDTLAAGLQIVTPRVVAQTVSLDTLQSSTGDAITVKLGAAGKLAIVNETGDEVVAFDQAGNGTFAGQISARTIALDTIQARNSNAITVKLGSDGKFAIVNASGEEVVAFDDKGNGTFKGTLTADTLKVTKIDGLDIMVNDVLSRNLGFGTPQPILHAPSDAVASLSATVASQSAQLQSLSEMLQGLISAINGSSSSATLAVLGESTSMPSQSVSLSDLSSDGLATVSGNLRVRGNTLVEGMLSVVDSVTTPDIIVTNLATFFSDTVFKGSVRFDKTAQFSQDSAGTALMKKGKEITSVTFAHEYEHDPVVTVSVEIKEVSDDDLHTYQQAGICAGDDTKSECFEKVQEKLLSSNLQFIVTQKSKKGFTIRTNKPAPFTIPISWIVIQTTKPPDSP